MSRPRRDPRGERRTQQVAAPRLRLDRMQRVASAHDSVTARTAEPAVIRIDDPAFVVLVVADAPSGLLTRLDRQLLGAARQIIGREAGAATLLSRTGPTDAAAAGADRLCLTPGDPDDPAQFAATVAAMIEALAPRAVLFGESAEGGDCARRVAALLDRPLFTDVAALGPAGVARAAGGGRVEQRGPAEGLLTLLPDSVAAYAGPPREARGIEPAEGSGAPALRLRPLPYDPSSLPLGQAEFVVAAGNGVSDYPLFGEVVRALRATPGASRVLCDRGDMPRDRQVGASGTVLSAGCYLALGIAGAPQHLQGVAGVEHVIAINTDLHAAMIARAKLAVVADAQAVMPALLRALAEPAA